jgi:hypothetical protein
MAAWRRLDFERDSARQALKGKYLRPLYAALKSRSSTNFVPESLVHSDFRERAAIYGRVEAS